MAHLHMVDSANPGDACWKETLPCLLQVPSPGRLASQVPRVRWNQAQWHSGDMEQFSPTKGKINDNSTNSPLGLANTQVPKIGRPILIMEHTHTCANQITNSPQCLCANFYLSILEGILDLTRKELHTHTQSQTPWFMMIFV